jgi:hypothetical protein
VLVDSCVVVDEDLFFGEVDIDEEFADTGAEEIEV